MKAMTLRLDVDLAERLALVADVDGQTVTETVRIALAAYLPPRLPPDRQKIQTRP